MSTTPFDVLWRLPQDFHDKMGVCPERTPMEATVVDERSAAVASYGTHLKILADEIENQCDMNDVRFLRMQLMIEELGEVLEAMANQDIEGLVDGLCDLLYVVGGTIASMGLKEVMTPAFLEVHRANMSKRNGDGSERVRDKGDDWQPPAIPAILEKCGIETQ